MKLTGDLACRKRLSILIEGYGSQRIRTSFIPTHILTQPSVSFAIRLDRALLTKCSSTSADLVWLRELLNLRMSQTYPFAQIGRVLGKALYDGILVDISFAGFFLAKWLGRQSYLDDLSSLDNELYKGLISALSAEDWDRQANMYLVLKNYSKPEDLSLNFTITEQGKYTA